MFCTNCGRPIPDGARFCTGCGQPVGGPSPEPAATPAAPAPEPVQPSAAGPVFEPVTAPVSSPDAAAEQSAPVGQPVQAPAAEPVAAPASAAEPQPMQGGAPFQNQEWQAPGQTGPYVPPQQAPGVPPFAPPPFQPPYPTQPPAKKNGKTLIVILIVVAALLLAAAAFLGYRWFSGNREFNADMTAAQEALDRGEYSAAIDACEAALERKPGNEDAVLLLVDACLRDGRFDQAARLLSDLDLEESDERYATLRHLTALVELDPDVDAVDTSSFPVVTVTLHPGVELTLSGGDFLLTEDGVVREITGLEQTGDTVRLSYRSEDTNESDLPRALALTLKVDGVTYHSSADYTTPHFDPATLELVTTDVSEYPLVKAFFRVTRDGTGEIVEGLSANSFTILERVQGGEYLAREVKSAVPLAGNVGMNIDLVADKSDSISFIDMYKIQNVMAEFVNSLHYEVGDKAELLAFDSIVQQMCYYTNDVDLLINGIYNMSTDGMTAFYDAVYDGVTNAALQGGARCVIAFTDGLDNRSHRTANDVITYANRKQVPVYIIGVGGSVEQSTLRRMAESTGGRYWYIDDLYDLEEIFAQVYSDLGDLYMVEYESDASLDSYLSRDLSVQMSGGGSRAGSEFSFAPVPSIRDNGGETHTSRYLLVEECLSWEEASRRCQEMGGHLATITSQTEMDLLVSMAEDAGMKYIWLGGYTSYDNYGGVFGHWVTGEDFDYQAWCVDEPSRVDLDGTEEWYIMLWNIPSLGGWTWNDQRNDPAAVVTTMADSMGFICEFEN